MSDTSFEESVWSDLQELDSFVPTKDQLKAIKERNRSKCVDLGITLNQYLYMISPKYRFKLCNLLT